MVAQPPSRSISKAWRTELARANQLVVDHVDGDDLPRPGDARALDHRHADTTDPEDRDR
jgi:hypothetical protein